jgi:hypothetical protein
MDTIELQHILDKSHLLKQLNAVVCPKNLLPNKKPSHVQAYIVNTHNANQPGEHWVAIFFKENSAYYFDSYGLPPMEEHILPFIRKHSRQWTYSIYCLQEGSMPVCGVYCIFALHFLAKGCKLDTIIQLKFTTEREFDNDKEVLRWFERNYGHLYAEAKTLIKPSNCQCCVGHSPHGANMVAICMHEPVIFFRY